MTNWVIRSSREDGYWSHSISGWVTLANATVFSDMDKDTYGSLPEEGVEWVELPDYHQQFFEIDRMVSNFAHSGVQAVSALGELVHNRKKEEGERVIDEGLYGQIAYIFQSLGAVEAKYTLDKILEEAD